MLERKFIRENQDAVRRAIEEKHIPLDFARYLALDSELLALEQKLQELSARRNDLSAEIPAATGAKKDALLDESKKIKESAAALEAKIAKVKPEYDDLLWRIPNIPAADAPRGADDSENKVVRREGAPRKFDFPVKSHYDLLVENGWADFERISKVSGSRSYALKGAAARLEIALHAFVMDKLTAKGFTMISTPSLAREPALFATGHFPSSREDVYYLPSDELYLSGTAEIPLTSLHAGEILEENQLPILYAGYSPCFRREAGAAGKDTRGLIRVHQFMKVEQYVICRADLEEQKKWHAALLAAAEEILRDLELPYQVVECCTGDMGAGKYKMNDLETWVPSENRYRETHSCSSLTDWQARRAGLRYRENGTNKVKYCYTLNNTGIATPRIIAQFLENHQEKDGRVKLPAAIRPYMNDKEYL